MKIKIKLIVSFCAILIVISQTYSQKTEKGKDAPVSFDPSRSYELVKQGMQKVFPQIKAALTQVSTMYKQKQSVSMKFYISPTGKMSLIGFLEPVTLDSAAEYTLKKSLHLQVLDTVREIETFTKVIIRSYPDQSNAVNIADDIRVEYVKIRSKSDILTVIDINSRSLRSVYSKRWAEKRGLEGKVIVKFGIDEHGNVVFSKVISATTNDPVFEKSVADNVMKWKFGSIDNPGDVTEFIYPFSFVQ